MPVLIVEKQISAQTGQIQYSVIDGQQRLRAILEFLDDRFALTASDEYSSWRRLRFSKLDEEDQLRLLRYALVVQQLEGYSEDEIRDIFVRLNRYVVRLAPQELRHARQPGAFAEFADELGRLPYWSDNRIFTPNQVARMRPAEFAAELVILVVEGPQDKKAVVDLYYEFFANDFPDSQSVRDQLLIYMEWIATAIDLPASSFHRAVDYYSLVGALDRVSTANDGELPPPERAAPLLREFEELLRTEEPPRDVTRYVAAASRQTDNLAPRMTRIEVLERLLQQA